MLRYEQIADKAKDMLAMTGYTKEEFTALLPQFQQSYDEYLQASTIEGYERVGQIPKRGLIQRAPKRCSERLFGKTTLQSACICNRYSARSRQSHKSRECCSADRA